MFARVNLVQTEPDARAKMEAAASRMTPVFRRAKGFQSITFFGNDEEGTYGSISIWASKEDAEAAASAIGPQMRDTLDAEGIVLTAQPQTIIVEVFEPQEVAELALDELSADGVLVVEWPERAGEDVLPKEHVRVEFEMTGEEERAVRISGVGERIEDIIGRLSD